MKSRISCSRTYGWNVVKGGGYGINSGRAKAKTLTYLFCIGR